MEQEKLQTISDERPAHQTNEQEKKRLGMLCQQILNSENQTYAGTRGISANNRTLGFIPAYLDTRTGEASISRFVDGRPAPIHVLDGLPDSWITHRDIHGRALKARQGIVAGFIREGQFYTRDQAAKFLPH